MGAFSERKGSSSKDKKSAEKKSSAFNYDALLGDGKV